MPQAATNVTQLAEKIAAAVPRFDPIGRRVAVSRTAAGYRGRGQTAPFHPPGKGP